MPGTRHRTISTGALTCGFEIPGGNVAHGDLMMMMDRAAGVAAVRS
jgi:hypothetical protein